MKHISIKALFMILLATFALSLPGAIPASERAALISLYERTYGYSWNDHSGWRTPPLDADGFAKPGSEGTWHGVTIMKDHVIMISLRENNLRGSIPPGLDSLTGLMTLDLSDNSLGGSIPPQIGNLSRLQVLNLRGNYFFGYAIPPEIGNLTNLIALDLSDSHFTGAIPAQIGNLANLISLDLSDCQFTGPLPAQLGNLINLQHLNLSHIEFRGSIPPQIGKLTKLVDLDLSHDFLTGPIPAEIGNLKSLQNVDLSWNGLTGIPDSIGNLESLQVLDLSWSDVTRIPDSIGDLKNLRKLDLSWNDLTAIPASIGGLTALQTLTILGNELACPIPPEIGNLASLRVLDLGYNHLTGDIPASIGNLSALQELYLSKNQLTGAIPAAVGNLRNLAKCNLDQNQLTGAIPGEIGNLTSLKELNLSENRFTAIPASIGNLTGLQSLNLKSNRLAGAIPSQIGSMTGLLDLSLEENQLTGNIPSQIDNLQSLQYLTLGYNQLSGAIPTQIGNLAKLSRLDLGNNRITGIIPPQIGNLASLRELNLRGNQLTGAIPSQISKLARLQRLDLGHNRLKGVIPSLIGNLTRLNALYLEANDLAGAIPASIVNLVELNPCGTDDCYQETDLGYNGLYSRDAAVIAFLNDKDPDWAATQTVAPKRVRAAASGNSTVNLTWDAIPYTGDPGGYRILAGTSKDGPFRLFQQTADKTVTSLPVTGLNSATRYYFVIRTRTDAHGDQQNIVVSENSAVAASTTLPGAIIVTAPAAGALWEMGMTYSITWLTQGAMDANVKIMLYKGAWNQVSTISAMTANDGTFDWQVPPTLAAGVNYYIQMQTADNTTRANSDKFSIIVPAITITAPAAGTVWVKGTTRTITWNKVGTQDANVRIQLFKDTIKKLDITLNTPNSGSFDWAIPSTLVNGTYTIRITTLDGKVKKTSKGFTIAKTAGLTLTSPNGNEIMKPVEIQTLRWSEDPNVLEVKLEFSRDNGGTYMTIADHAPNTGSYDWPVPINFTRNGIIRVSDASGKPWLNEGLLEFNLKFIYTGDGDDAGAILWFGGSDPEDPGYGFAKIAIGSKQVQFGGISKAIEPLTGNWHELRVRFDFRRDTAEIKLDDQPLFENAPLDTSREHYFQPNLVLQTGGTSALDFTMDDLAIYVVRPDDQGADKERFNVLSDDFDRYDERSNPLQNCWQGLGMIDKANKIEISVDSPVSKSLRLRTEAGRQMLIFLPFSLPDKVPFDVSDKCLVIENR